MNNYNLISKIKNILRTEYGTIHYTISQEIIRNLNNIKKLTITSLAEKANCSKSSVINYCKYLGLDGYKELIQTLIFENKILEPTLSRVNLKNVDKVEQVKLRNYHDLIKNNISYIETQEVGGVIEASKMTKLSKRIFLVGKGANLNILSIFDNYLKKLNFWSIYSKDIDVQRKYAENIQPDDIAYIFSYSGLTPEIIEIYNNMKEKGARIVLITSNHYSPMYDPANINITVLNNEEVLEQQRNSIMSFIFIIMEIIYLLSN